MTSPFDQITNRHDTDSIKWQRYGADVLPMWVADMDFPSPEPILTALKQRIEHGVFGYGSEPKILLNLLVERLAHFYNWQVSPEHIVLLPGLVSGLNIVCRAIGDVGDAVLTQTPVYPPFLSAPTNQQRELQTVSLQYEQTKQFLKYRMDYEALEKAITPRTRLFLLCHPHNPVGRLFTPEELQQLAEICLKHQLVICSDEIHCDLLLDGRTHTPLAALSPEIADNCITFMAASKTFNIAGLGCSFAIIQNPQLRQQFKRAMQGIVPEVNILGVTASIAAYQSCETWRQDLLDYLSHNSHFISYFTTMYLPELNLTAPEATFLGWLDCRALPVADPFQYFLTEAKIAFNDGATFGEGGAGFIRLNFGCPREQLIKGLNRIRDAVGKLKKA
ncbi:bifunctional PLP-dependent enzyme with beta-cystathionase and maltose regulon repressor activities [Beggiatoa alba B18LD]|uniref:cysteine-S-conjugate beta-lyase n=1 Tax=Beggiatoa alba B18LD TaxID=395493 RepID=I3CEH3_9GAMM|nr:PatB family C-S lyase [Beggiatoa alba]EIJ42016.1 bifunctional PLP-dependent enzyme with beta-cystathionase and maltose regulon repressor activities [Beggiatoa alba B18LD]